MTETASALDQWMHTARDTLAEASRKNPSELDLDQSAIDDLLDIARIASHESGDRRNAPLLCYLIGKASEETDLGALTGALRRALAKSGHSKRSSP